MGLDQNRNLGLLTHNLSGFPEHRCPLLTSHRQAPPPRLSQIGVQSKISTDNDLYNEMERKKEREGKENEKSLNYNCHFPTLNIL